MLRFKDTGLEEFSFGKEKEDLFYILINKKISPEGIDVDKLRLSDPRNFDAVLNEMGCILMLNGTEVEELIKRGELIKNELHTSIYSLARDEGIIR